MYPAGERVIIFPGTMARLVQKPYPLTAFLLAPAWHVKCVQRPNVIKHEIVKAMKSKSGLVLMALALLAGKNWAMAQPTLGIAQTNSGAILFWSANAGGTNGVLQSAAALNSPNWVQATDVATAPYGSCTAVAVGNCSSAQFFRLALVPPAPDGMALVPAGSFTMGDTLDGDGDAGPVNVYVSDYYMDTNLVSYSQWQTVYSCATNVGYEFDDAGSGKNNAAGQPVQTINWYDAVKWCNARSQQAGLTPIYYTDAGLTQVYMAGQVTNPFVNWTANGYRLPTEAEWEKAARGGLSDQRFPSGLTISESQANYEADPGDFSYDLGPYPGYNTNFDTGGEPYTSPVGYLAPNGYGIYDMAGNLWEWCWDLYATPYGQPTTNNPTGPTSVPYAVSRVLRGGNWDANAWYARCAHRIDDLDPGYGSNLVGFRCVREY